MNLWNQTGPRCRRVSLGPVSSGGKLNDTPGFPGGSEGEESACRAGDLGLIPESGGSPGGGHGSPLQCPGLESPVDRGAWRATVHRVAESRTD